jgi:predicted nucleic acid-binding protein
MLVDSSVWIAFLRGNSTIEVDLLTRALSSSKPVWLAPPILQEVLQGAQEPERFFRWNRVLGELPLLVLSDQRSGARDAAHLYAQCRWSGVTPRSTNDCLIAVHAIAHNMPLLQSDKDFILISKVDSRLRLLPHATR